jgi:hypothetical protein
MYDPNLGRFISADTIIPDRSNPQSRNRYSYVLNNPLKYTDPSGHCYEGSGEEADCQAAVEALEVDGAYIAGLWLWRLSELNLILQAIADFKAFSQWSSDQFKAAIGGYTTFYRGGEGSAYQQGQQITLYNGTFSSGDDWATRTIVHELAHQWDAMSTGHISDSFVIATRGVRGNCFDMSNGYGGCVAGTYKPGDTDYLPTPRDPHYTKNKYEDFAESVAATIYGAENPVYADSRRDRFVREQFDNYRR